MLDLILHTTYMERAEKWTDMLRFLCAAWHHGEIVNGYAPFFWRKSLDISGSHFPMWTAMLRFQGDFGIHHTSLTTGERQCSVFSSDFQRFRRYWTAMLRFFSRFQADFLLTSGWIEPLLVGGYAPFSPFLEVHHTKPLASYDDEHTIPQSEMCALCPYCHSMVHRKKSFRCRRTKKKLNIKKQVYIILCIAVQMCNNCYRKGHYFLFIMLSS